MQDLRERARASTLTAQTTLASGRTAARAVAGRPGGSDRQTDPFGGGDELALPRVQFNRFGEPRIIEAMTGAVRLIGEDANWRPSGTQGDSVRSNPEARQTFTVARAVRVVCHPADRDRVANAALDKSRGDVGRRAAKPRPFVRDAKEWSLSYPGAEGDQALRRSRDSRSR